MSTPKLIISLEDKVVEEIPIEKEIITIGRRTDNDLCLDNLAISGYHSQISSVLDDCFLEDLDSTNGTFVNSKIVKKHALKDGDIIDIGNHRIKYINHLASSSANSEFEKTLIMTATTERKNALNEEQDVKELEDHIDSIDDGADDLTRDNVEREMSAKKEQGAQSLDSQINSLEKEMCESPEDTDNDVQDSSTQTDEETNNKINDSSDAEDKDSKFEQAIASNPTTDSSSNDTDDIQINSQPPASSIGRIQILNGKNSGKEITLDKSLTTVGKPDVAVVGITKRNTGYFIMHIDGNPKTPSKLNGEVIAAKAEPIEDHDIIDVAGIKLEFFVE